MLPKENGTTRKQVENQMGGKPVLQNRQVSVGEEMLCLLHIWDQRAEGCGICKEKQEKKREEF